MKFSISVLTIFHLCNLYCAQRIAPGVPPQQYAQGQQVPVQQQVPHRQVNQQQQQVHMQQQQVPIQQQQQVPMQQQQQVPMQQQQQVPMQQQQQVPVQHVQHSGHGHNRQAGQILNANIAQEKEHIAEHMEVPIDTSKMTEQELQFHYFKMHDADNNNKLDGCELIKSLIHWHEPKEGSTEPAVQSDEELAEIIDPLLSSMDENSDGYIDYAEFKSEVNTV